MNDSDQVANELREALAQRLAELEFAQKQVVALRLESSVRIAFVASLEAELASTNAKLLRAEHAYESFKLKYANDVHSARVESAEAIQTKQTEIERLVMRAAALQRR